MTWAGESWSIHDEEMRPALTLTMGLRQASMGLLLLHDASGGVMRIAMTEGLSDDGVRALGAPDIIAPMVDRACAEHRRISVPDVRSARGADLAAIRELGRQAGFRGIEVLPLLRREGLPLGAIVLLFRSPLRLFPNSQRLLGSATSLISLALDNALQLSDEHRQRRTAEQRAYDRLQFMSMINHELRTPLQSITGYIELLDRGEKPDAERLREILDHIQDSKHVLLSIIDSVANMGRMEAGRMTYTIGGVTIGDVLARVASVVEPFANRQQVEVLVDESLRSHLVHGDQGKITQILINLLTNAVKFTPAKGTVRLETRQAGSSFHFIVKDEGPGIPPDKLGAIFEPWVQFDQRRNSPLAGYGLGLTVSRELAIGMGGTLEVENATPPDTGAIFTFTIRAHRADRPAWRSRSAAPAAIVAEPPPPIAPQPSILADVALEDGSPPPAAPSETDITLESGGP